MINYVLEWFGIGIISDIIIVCNLEINFKNYLSIFHWHFLMITLGPAYLVVAIFSTCTKKSNMPWIRYYNIKAGRHKCYRWPFIKLYWKRNSLSFRFEIPQSAVDGLRGAPFISKIYGFSHGWHHKNSYRLGFAVDDLGIIKLYGYSYKDGTSPQKCYGLKPPICEVKADDDILCNIYISESGYCNVNYKISSSNGIKSTSHWASLKRPNWGYALFPYIGGQGTSKTNICIPIWDIH